MEGSICLDPLLDSLQVNVHTIRGSMFVEFIVAVLHFKIKIFVIDYASTV